MEKFRLLMRAITIRPRNDYCCRWDYDFSKTTVTEVAN